MIQDIGNQQTGSNADTSGLTLNGTMLVPPGGVLPTGLPVARNILAIEGGYMEQFAAAPGLGAFAGGDDQVTLTNIGSGIYGGVTLVQASNPWLNTPLNSLNVSPLLQPTVIVRTGLRPVLCGAINGGTSVKVGDFVGKSSTTTGASTAPFLLSTGPTAAATVPYATYGVVAASPIWTTLNGGVAAGAGVVVTVFNTDSMSTTTSMVINPSGQNQETVVPTAVTADAPAVSTLTIALVQGSAATVQLTFNIAGYQGSTGLVGPLGTLTTTFTLIVPIPATTSAAAAAALILTAIQNSGFAFGASENILGINSGTFANQGTLAGSPATGPLIYVSSPSSGVLTFSAAMPGTWANTNLTYTITVLGGTTQTYNTSTTGSATAVAFASGVNGSFTATLQNPHVTGEYVVGYNTTSGSALVNVPSVTGQQNVALCYVDLITA